MNSRNYQNILHFVGVTGSVLMIYGAVSVGAGDSSGIIIMFTGALFQRLSSEIEFRKISKLIEEKTTR